MHGRIARFVFAGVLALIVLFRTIRDSQAQGEEPPAMGIPLRPDPPPALDGDVEEWRGRKGAIIVNRAEQVTFGTGWRSPSDCGGAIWVAWRADGLYLAAEVADDVIRQFGRAAELYRGDNVQVFLDADPAKDADRDPFGRGQFQIALSPGNFLNTGDPFVDLPAEAYVYQPIGLDPAGIRVVSARTTHGWNVEALIPWKLVGMEGAAEGRAFAIEVALSDTDGDEPKQETWLTSSPRPWSIVRSRLNPVRLARADGTVRDAPATPPLFDQLALRTGEEHRIAFTAPRAGAGEETTLSLFARMDTPKPAGYTAALRIAVNGHWLDGSRLIRKPLRGTAADGRTHSLVAIDRFSVFYAPDFVASDTSVYGIAGVKTGEFHLRITDLVVDGSNELRIANAANESVTVPMVLAEGRLATGVGERFTPRGKAGPPTGPLDVVLPAESHRVEYAVREGDAGRIEVDREGDRFTIASAFSMPDGAWAHGTTAHFEHRRRIERADEAIIVHDTFVNRTGANLPLMQRHRVEAAGGIRRVWVAGLSPASLNGTASSPANPTVFGATDAGGIGLMPLNDEFLVHARQESVGGVLALSDPYFVLRPGTSYTAEWAIVPVRRGDYFEFVNAARRIREANFTIKDCFAFLRAGPLTEAWSDAAFADFIRFKSASLVCASIDYPRYNGVYTHGTSFQRVPHDSYRRWVERVRRLAPGVKTCVYFHCFLDTVEDSPQVFADSRHLRSDGTQADYGEPIYKNFFPTDSNSYGRVIGRNVERILDEIGADGVYWDELEYSAYQYHYGEPWDGCSADIDLTSHRIQRLKSSVTLVSQPWRVALAKRILERGPLVGNGQPHTRTIAQLKFPRFVETGSPSHCALAQLHSPIALGDHLTERSESDAYRGMLGALDFGCLYHWYSDAQVMPSYPTLTHYMYPATPLELHDGYVIARERIVTKRSGLFGWRDGARHETHVFDAEGREVPDFQAPSVTRDGFSLTELRLPEDWSAVVIRLE
ncbi:MAG: hypothetical protein FJ297_10720 [Planctomycetes bacterium]|nr:hypothetical protein [Planctomycetota bacterium]